MSVVLTRNLAAADALVSSQGLLDLVQLIWSQDRYFTYPAYQQTAKNVCSQLQEWGVKGEIHPIPADGKTVYGDWKMPLGWDCTEATLDLVEPAEQACRLADRNECRTNVIMWSGPTPPEGLTAEVIRIDDRADLKGKRDQARGKIVYTPSHPGGLKRLLAEAGAAAIVTGYSRFGEQPQDACFWFNGWSDDPQGWAFHATDTPLPGMALTPLRARQLENAIKPGRTVKLRMKVVSRYMETFIPVVSGVVPGSGAEEVLAIGHSMEQGANDNASGAAVILESLRVIEQGVRLGKLAPLRRSVRGLLVQECYGTVGFAACHPDVIKRTVAAVNWDTLGRFQEAAHAKFRHFRTPDAAANVSDTLMLLLLEAWQSRMPFVSISKDRPFSLTDNVYGDPLLGVQCPYVDSQDRFWHTSADTMEMIDGKTLRAFAAISAAYLHFLATAHAPEALWLARQTCTRYAQRMQETAAKYWAALQEPEADRPVVLAQALDHLQYVLETGERAVRSAERLIPASERAGSLPQLERIAAHLRENAGLESRELRNWAGCAPGALPPAGGAEIADIAPLCPERKFTGTPAYESIPLEKRDPKLAPAWNSALHCALFWADGRVSFETILRRVGYEHGPWTLAALPDHFRFMAQRGLLEWRKPGA